MGDLAAALEDTTDPHLWRKLCAVHQAMVDYPDEADTIFEFCTFRVDKSSTMLSETFAGHGIEVSYQAITRHRNQRCKCHVRMPHRYDS